MTTTVTKVVELTSRRLDRANYSDYESNVLRIISISSCSASLLACLIMYYTYLAIHPSRRMFRHQLIFFLVTFDFLKAIAMIVFPILTYLNPEQVGRKTINFLGFFTAFSIEGGDLAILSFAVHTLLTIFYPQQTGGLFFVRYYVYVISVLLPVILAGLAFINNVGYVALNVFCYLPESPRWYRLVLSWCPRYFIMGAIIVIYCTIYFYVINQLKKMERNHGTLDIRRDKPSFLSRLNPGRFIHNTIKEKSTPQTSSSQTNQMHTLHPSNPSRTDTNINMELQYDNSQRLRTRYKVIARQIKIVFLYPIAYFILWIFPLIQNSLALEHKSNYGIIIIVAFIQPFNGVVDTIVWMHREKPWTLTYANTPRSPFSQEEPVAKWRHWVKYLPLFTLPHLDEERDGGSSPTLAGVMEPKALAMNSLMMSMNPEEFAHTGASSTPAEETSDRDTGSSGGVSTYKRNFSVVSSNAGEENEMDLLDFLNQGPSVP